MLSDEPSATTRRGKANDPTPSKPTTTRKKAAAPAKKATAPKKKAAVPAKRGRESGDEDDAPKKPAAKKKRTAKKAVEDPAVEPTVEASDEEPASVSKKKKNPCLPRADMADPEAHALQTMLGPMEAKLSTRITTKSRRLVPEGATPMNHPMGTCERCANELFMFPEAQCWQSTPTKCGDCQKKNKSCTVVCHLRSSGAVPANLWRRFQKDFVQNLPNSRKQLRLLSACETPATCRRELTPSANFRPVKSSSPMLRMLRRRANERISWITLINPGLLLLTQSIL